MSFKSKNHCSRTADLHETQADYDIMPFVSTIVCFTIFHPRIKMGVFGAKLDNNCISSTSKIRESGCDRRVSFSSIRQGLGQAGTRSPTSASFFVWQSRATHHRSSPQKLPTCAGLYRGPHFGSVFLYGRISASTYDSDSYEGPSGFPDGIHNSQVALSKSLAGVPTISQKDLVALMGLHGSGGASFQNSGFSGPWGPASDLNTINNNFYVNLLSLGFPNAVFTQKKAIDSNFGVPPAGFTGDKIQWVHTSGRSNGKMMLPTDMEIYHNFTVNSTGGTNEGQYCPQGNNAQLQPCPSTANKNYLPLARNAPLAMLYAQDNTAYMNDLVTAFLNMVSYRNPQNTVQSFSPVWQCNNGIPYCYGGVLFTGCGRILYPVDVFDINYLINHSHLIFSFELLDQYKIWAINTVFDIFVGYHLIILPAIFIIFIVYFSANQFMRSPIKLL